MNRLDTTPSAHGTSSRYNNTGCRCAQCRDAWATYVRERRRARGMQPRETYYTDKVDRGITVRPTGLGLQLLSAAKARTGRSASDIVEHLLRAHGSSVHFDAVTT